MSLRDEINEMHALAAVEIAAEIKGAMFSGDFPKTEFTELYKHMYPLFFNELADFDENEDENEELTELIKVLKKDPQEMKTEDMKTVIDSFPLFFFHFCEGYDGL